MATILVAITLKYKTYISGLQIHLLQASRVQDVFFFVDQMAFLKVAWASDYYMGLTDKIKNQLF